MSAAASESGSQLWGWEALFDEIDSFLLNSGHQFGQCEEAYAYHTIERLEVFVSTLTRLKNHLEVNVGLTSERYRLTVLEYASRMIELIGYLRSLAQEWQSYIDAKERLSHSLKYQAILSQSTSKGRPRFLIPKEQLEFLRSLYFTWSEIAQLIGVSRMTIYRRREEFNMVDEPTATLTDSELKQKVSEIRQILPEVGEKIILGQLRSMGYHITRWRVRETLRQIDPVNTAMRWPGGLTARRQYSVPGPNSLWHIGEYSFLLRMIYNYIFFVDGHHKLIRWKIVTHAGIDGYSRMIVFMRSSNNNKAYTVYTYFVDAVDKYGLPSRVRSDQGKENKLVAEYMLECRGENRGSMLTGSSIHNQRIERLWKDMHYSVTKTFYRLFYYLEELRLLDPSNDMHIYSLHYVYLPRINHALAVFKNGWNRHGIRTEHASSPEQLFVAGALQLRNSGLAALDFFDNINNDYYGVDEEGLPGDNDDDAVFVPDNEFSLSEELFQQLQDHVNPLAESDNYGIEFYQQTIDFIGNHI